MPPFSFAITVPKDTEKEIPHEEVHKLPMGILTEGSIMIPAGHKGLTGLQLFYMEKQILPVNTGGFFTGDKDTIHFEANVKIERAPFQLKSLSWNTDTENPHDFYVNISMKTRGNPGNFLKERKGKKRRLSEREITEIVDHG